MVRVALGARDDAEAHPREGASQLQRAEDETQQVFVEPLEVGAGPVARTDREVGDALALVAFGDRGLILTDAAKPTVPKWAVEAQAVRMNGDIASFAKQDEALVIATAAYVAWA